MMINNVLHSMPGGLAISVNPALDDVPRMQVSSSFAALMPPDFVVDLNGWMLQFFGTENPVYKLADGRLVMGRKAYAQLQALAR